MTVGAKVNWLWKWFKLETTAGKNEKKIFGETEAKKKLQENWSETEAKKNNKKS